MRPQRTEEKQNACRPSQGFAGVFSIPGRRAAKAAGADCRQPAPQSGAALGDAAGAEQRAGGAEHDEQRRGPLHRSEARQRRDDAADEEHRAANQRRGNARVGPFELQRERRGGGQHQPHAEEQREESLSIQSTKVIAYVDGSYDDAIKKYSFGCVILTPLGETIKEYGNGDNPDSLALRNVAGEMLGAMFAVKWAIKNGYTEIELRYDYEGIEKWVTGEWKAKTELTKKYANAMKDWEPIYI